MSRTKALLSLNEMPYDIPAELKRRINEATQTIPLNRYPESQADSLVAKLASWYDLPAENIMVGPGSSALIRLLLTYYGLSRPAQLIIARPNFSYYEDFCQAFGISYDTWELDGAFQYNIATLGPIPAGSVVCLTTPNNPTGNLLSTSMLELLLKRHANSLFIVDEAYAEFAPTTMLPLLNDYSNLILLRTFSKALGAAGLRVGVLLAGASHVTTYARLQTPWQLTSGTIAAAKVILAFEQETGWATRQVQHTEIERERVFHTCVAFAPKKSFVVFPSSANFILFQAQSNQAHMALIEACERRGILVRNLHGQPRLTYCTRVTIGTVAENDRFIEAFRQIDVPS